MRAVAGGRVEPLVRAAASRVDARDRGALIEQYRAVITHLRAAGLGDAIAPTTLVDWAARTLARVDVTPPAADGELRDRAAFAAERGREPSLSITECLLRISIAALPPRRVTAGEPAATGEAVREVVRGLDESIRARVVELDLRRARRVVHDLESWWRGLLGADDDRGLALLEQVVASGFLNVMRGDGEPLRVLHELTTLREVFPAGAAQAAELRERLAALDAASTKLLIARLEIRAERAWSDSLTPRARGD
ncbi:MAG: hypothetical protein H6713_35880 [Myxococcales bacterium]|nr:hypothetical protein [Myxococcales bacterium]